MKRCLCLFLLILLLIVPVSAEESLEEIMADYMERNGLGTHNYSVSYYNTVTGESYAFNDKKFMVAASTFKLPLNMYYYEMERDGQIESDALIPEAGVRLDVAHKESLVNSNNEYSIGLLYHLGDFPTYKQCMRKYFTMPDDEIDYIYYADNYYCTHMMMDALRYLYENRGDFPEMLDYMKQAQPGQYFKAGVTEYEVAHKYGWFEGAVNDVGIIYTEEPFLLAVYTQDAGDWVVADTARLLTDYNVRNLTPPEPEEEPEISEGKHLTLELVPVEEEEQAVEEPVCEEEPEPVPEALPEEPESAFEWWMVAVALAVFVLGGGATVLIFNPKRLEKALKDEEEEETAR